MVCGRSLDTRFNLFYFLILCLERTQDIRNEADASIDILDVLMNPSTEKYMYMYIQFISRHLTLNV